MFLKKLSIINVTHKCDVLNSFVLSLKICARINTFVSDKFSSTFYPNCQKIPVSILLFRLHALNNFCLYYRRYFWYEEVTLDLCLLLYIFISMPLRLKIRRCIRLSVVFDFVCPYVCILTLAIRKDLCLANQKVGYNFCFFFNINEVDECIW